jgi:Fur family zinc uptake transcriptional regulator
MAYVDLVEQCCEQRGLRLTPLRADVLEQIVASTGPIKAYDLVARLSSRRGMPVAPMVVYRALHFLTRNGFVQRLESVNAFVARLHPLSDRASPYLVCDSCGSAVEVADDDVATRIEAIARASGFTPRRQMLEVGGLCRNCAGSNALLGDRN